MKNIVYILIVFLGVSCSKTKKLHDRLIGEWNIEQMKGSVVDSNYTFEFDQANAGTFSFKEVFVTAQGGTYSFLVFDPKRSTALMSEDETFTWENTGAQITTNNNDGKVVVWEVVSSEKTTQEWKTSFNLNERGTKRAIISKMVLKKK